DNASLSGTVFGDTNSDGMLDNGEKGIGSVTVTLLEGGNPVATTTTAPDGTYSFSGLAPGAYTIVTQVSGARATTPDPLTVTLTSIAKPDQNVGFDAKAALTLVKNGPATLVAGKAVTYHLVVGNNGPDTATSVTVKDQLPTSLTYDSASGAGWTCTASGQTVTCTDATGLQSGKTSTIDLTATVVAGTVGAVTNTASVSGQTVGGPAIPATAMSTGSAPTPPTTTPPTTVDPPPTTVDPPPATLTPRPPADPSGTLAVTGLPSSNRLLGLAMGLILAALCAAAARRRLGPQEQAGTVGRMSTPTSSPTEAP
ncbi:MAG: DUF11 domain-containing protein, partial [Acidimicrobiia bacterium]|nr:DUF11 domain-containing protein [Acidimicrobiia bacterium]